MRAYPIDPDYAVTENGDVFRVRGGRSSPGRPFKLSTHVSKRGYTCVWAAGRVRCVHRMVAETYLPNPEGLPYAAHKNGIRTDPQLSNVRWSSAVDNSADMVEHGTRLFGQRAPWAVLTASDVEEIRAVLAGKRARAKPYHSDLAARFGVSRECISRIAQGKNWRHAD